MGPRPARTAQCQRADQEGRRRAQRAGPHREHLRQGRLRQHRQERPARTVPLVGPLHPARAGLRRHLDRRREHRHARGQVLHAAGPLRRRCADARPRCARSARSRPSSPATPPTSPTGRTCSTTGSDVEDMPEIWRRLDTVGLQTTEACGDCPRVVLGSPLAGESLDEVIDGTPAIDEIVSRYIGKPEYSNLPRKFKTAISGLQDVVHEINDVAFIGVNHPEHGPGFDLWVGGGLSTNPMLGQRVGAWVPLDEVPDVWEGRGQRVPRLRLPAAACQGPAEVPDQGLGHPEVPGSPGNRVPQASADRRTRPRTGGAPDRSRRRAATQERAQRRRRGPDRGPGVGHDPDARSPTLPRRPARTGSGSRRTRSSSSSTSPTRSSTS